MAKNVHEDWVEISGRKVKYNEKKAWIKDRRNDSEYSGTYIVPVSEMSENIGLYSNKELKQQLAKYSARMSKLQETDDSEVESEMEDICEEVARILIRDSPYVCSGCLRLFEKWEDMTSGMYTHINCPDCSR